MKFECDRCHKRFSTAEEPVPGRMYRVPCRCGNIVVLQLDAAAEPLRCGAASTDPPRPPRARRVPPPLPLRARPPRQDISSTAVARIAMPPLPAPSDADDPFAPARADSPDLRVLLACASEDVTPTVAAAPRARIDPDAAGEVSIPYGAVADDPFAQAVRRARTHALALGGAAGGAVGALCAAVLTVTVLRAPPPPAIEALELALPLAQPVAPAAPPAARRPPTARKVAAAVHAPLPAAPDPASRARSAQPATGEATDPAARAGAAAVAPAAAPARVPAVALTTRAPSDPERVEAAAPGPAPPDAPAVLEAARAEAADDVRQGGGSAEAVSDGGAAEPASSEEPASIEEPATEPGPTADDPAAPDGGPPVRAAHVASGP